MKEDDRYQDEDQQPSKTRRKKDMIALQELGKELLAAPAGLLDRLALPEDLRKALAEYKRLPNSHEAKRRQLQYIGRLMRDVDGEEIRAVLDQSNQNVELEKRRFHRLEELRDRLIDGDDVALESLIKEHPEVEIQHLRQLIRQARKERDEGKPPAASRKLFRYLRELPRAE